MGVRVDDAPAGGVVVVEVAPGSPAAAAGLKEDDLLVKLNGRDVRSRLDYFLLLRWTRPGQAVPVEVVRRAETVQMKVPLRAKRPEAGEEDGAEGIEE
jgi:S1-C subfamily serine protease